VTELNEITTVLLTIMLRKHKTQEVFRYEELVLCRRQQTQNLCILDHRIPDSSNAN